MNLNLCMIRTKLLTSAVVAESQLRPRNAEKSGDLVIVDFASKSFIFCVVVLVVGKLPHRLPTYVSHAAITSALL